jgi:PAS domain S-box-containing protein
MPIFQEGNAYMATTVLVVEDEADLEFLISRKFRKRIRAGELHFLFARNGQEALEQLAGEPDVYVVMSDIRMPVMDGLTLLSHLNEQYPLVRTIIVSAYGDMRNIRTAMNRGAYDFLTKPIDFADLEATLDKTIRRVQQMLDEVQARKRAESQLVKLEKAVQNMRLGVTISDLTGKILYTNPADAHMHGYQVKELLGQDVGVFAPPHLRHPMSPEMIQQWNGSVRESTNIHRNGSTFPVWLISDTVKDEHGHPMAVVTSCEDITERKHAEEELKRHRDHLEELVEERTKELSQANAQLAEMNISKDKFFSIISHDLKNPFSIMLGYSQLLEDNFKQYTPEKVFRLIQKLHGSAERLYVLLENLLTWARIQQGGIECVPDTLDIHKVIEENRDLLLSIALQKQIDLQNNVPARTHVFADYNMISTIVRNLLSNALKFTPEGGHVNVSCQQQDDCITIAVSDTGLGIKPEALPKLFRIDVQYTNIGTAGEKGSGLGLNLCKDLVEANNGTIAVESTPGQGTTFTVSLPQKKQVNHQIHDTHEIDDSVALHGEYVTKTAT